MSKAAFHQKLIGRKVVEDAMVDWLDNRFFKYYGLAGSDAEIVGAWLDDGAVKVLIVDERGRSAEVFLKLFILKEEGA